jgi:hypothetical protein
VNVPSPARLAFHKLWVASRRPASEQAKSRKDMRQAEQLLDVVSTDRPDDLSPAYHALPASMRRVVNRALARLPAELHERVRSMFAS